MNTILTITCDRDLRELLLQINSIELFVTPKCIHWVVVESTIMSEAEWLAILSPLYNNHDLRFLIEPAVISTDVSGWRRQQYYKLWISEKIQSEKYLILDSKNHFIEPINDLTQWPIAEGNGLSFPVEYLNDPKLFFSKSHIYQQEIEWMNYIKQWVDSIALPNPKMISLPFTPFVMKTKTARTIIDQFGLDAFTNDTIVPFEVILYDFFMEHSPNPNYVFNSYSFRRSDLALIHSADDFMRLLNEQKLVYGIHRLVKPNFEVYKQIYITWLVNKGFDEKFISRCFN